MPIAAQLAVRPSTHRASHACVVKRTQLARVPPSHGSLGLHNNLRTRNISVRLFRPCERIPPKGGPKGGCTTKYGAMERSNGWVREPLGYSQQYTIRLQRNVSTGFESAILGFDFVQNRSHLSSCEDEIKRHLDQLSMKHQISGKDDQSVLACSTVTIDDMERINLLSRIDRGIRILGDQIRSILSSLHKLLQIWLRSTEIAVIASPICALAPLTSSLLFLEDTIFNITYDASKVGRRMEDVTWRYALWAIHQLGPAFIKLSQWCATRRDIFPPHVCDRLSSLHSSARIHSWNHTEKVLKESFGEHWSNCLHVDPKDVIGSGTVAQVYKGEILRDTDADNVNRKTKRKKVAIKVLHPRIHELVDRDLLFMKRTASFLDSLPFKGIHVLALPRAVQSFEHSLGRQVDLRIEGENLRQFHENFGVTDDDNDDSLEPRKQDIISSLLRKKLRDAGFSSSTVMSQKVDVTFPKPVPGWVSRDVLVEDLISSTSLPVEESSTFESASVSDKHSSSVVMPISAFLSDDSQEGMKTRKKLARPLLNAFLQMVFGDNFVHCDLHPGNILVKATTIERPDGSQPTTNYTIVLLDAGITSSLTPQGQRNLKDLFRAVVFNEGEKAGRLMVERARYEQCSQVEGGVEAFSKGISDIVSEFHDNRKQGLTLGAVRIGSLLGRVLDLCRIHGVELDPSMASIVLSTVILEGLGRALEPDLNLIDFAMPFIIGRTRM